MPSLNAHQAKVLENAAYFTAVRGAVSASWRVKREFKTIDEARAFARTFGDGRTMIYAVTAEGRDAHIENA